MDNSLDTVVSSPIADYGPWALLIVAGVFLYWITFTPPGREKIAALFDIAYVSVLISCIWILVLSSLAWVFDISFSIASIFV